MNKLTFSLVIGVGMFASGAEAGPLTKGISQVDNGLLRVRMVCDQHGTCREEHHDQPVVVVQDRPHEPRREDHGERPHDRPAVVIQQDRPHEPRREHERPPQHGQPGIGVQVPGVSIGVGGNSHERR